MSNLEAEGVICGGCEYVVGSLPRGRTRFVMAPGQTGEQMEITFTRGEERTYSATALRDDGVLLLVPGGDRMFSMPHDLAHCIVEKGLGLKRGFWGRVAEGALYPGIKVLSGRQPPRAAEKSRTAIREMEQQGVEAEVVVGAMLKIMHEGLDKNWTAARAVLNNEWRPSKPERCPPDAGEVRHICRELREMEQRWQALEPGQSITIAWPSQKRNRGEGVLRKEKQR